MNFLEAEYYYLYKVNKPLQYNIHKKKYKNYFNWKLPSSSLTRHTVVFV